MASKSQPQTPPSHVPSPDLESGPKVPFTPSPTHHSNPNNTNDLQQKYKALQKKLVGENTFYSPSSPSRFFSPSPSSPYPFFSASPHEAPSQEHPNYDQWSFLRDPNTTKTPEPPSIPDQCSWASMHFSYPYILDPVDLTRRLSAISPESLDRDDKQKARLARESDRAHAAVKANEDAALRALQDICEGEKSK
ncbi:hypothetical protein F4679DRAFT_593272 [Xylaria curta]|nr:hypothetical protein F4679DRAFT_593272 [Xylaria curta]